MKFFNALLLVSIFIISTSANSYSNLETDRFNTYRYKEGNEGPWYEWWYYKIVLPKIDESFFFVYGVVNPWDRAGEMKGTRSYIGIGDFTANKQVEQRLPINDFFAARDKTLVEILGHTATDKNFNGNLIDKDGQVYAWDIKIEKKWSFNAEGWLTGTMLTDIEWYPAQADASCTGWIKSGVKYLEFENEPCYQDRNWGKRFPVWWSWIVSNHFVGHPDTALAIGGGRPHLRGRPSPYAGLAVGLKHKGKVYAFRPNHLSKVDHTIKMGTWEVTAINKRNKVEISATAPKSKFMDLQFMTPEGVIFHDYETLTGTVKVKLYKRHGFGWKLVDEIISHHAGIEYGSRDEHK